MKLDRSIFQIDAENDTGRLCAFIRERMTSLHRDGIIVPLSGGLDSSTVLGLCARAVGPDRVTALLMPEGQGNPEAARFSRIAARHFHVRTLTRDITPLLVFLGTYNFILSAVPVYWMQGRVARWFMARTQGSPFQRIITGTGSHLERKAAASYRSKHRIRMVVEFMLAEQRNLLVAGCAHKSEDMLGVFVKFGWEKERET